MPKWCKGHGTSNLESLSSSLHLTSCWIYSKQFLVHLVGCSCTHKPTGLPPDSQDSFAVFCCYLIYSRSTSAHGCQLVSSLSNKVLLLSLLLLNLLLTVINKALSPVRLPNALIAFVGHFSSQKNQSRGKDVKKKRMTKINNQLLVVYKKCTQ